VALTQTIYIRSFQLYKRKREEGSLKRYTFILALLLFLAFIPVASSFCCYGPAFSTTDYCFDQLEMADAAQAQDICNQGSATWSDAASCNEIAQCTTYGCCCDGTVPVSNSVNGVVQAACEVSQETNLEFIPYPDIQQSGSCSEICQTSGPPPVTTYSIVGKVVNGAGQGLANVQIYYGANLQWGLTDGAGNFVISSLNPGTYTVRAESGNACSDDDQVTVVDQNVPLQLTLTCTDFPIWQCTSWSACIFGQQTRTCTQTASTGGTTPIAPESARACQGEEPGQEPFCDDAVLSNGEKCYYDPATNTFIDVSCGLKEFCIPKGLSGGCLCLVTPEDTDITPGDGICEGAETCENSPDDCSESCLSVCEQGVPAISGILPVPQSQNVTVLWSITDRSCIDHFILHKCTAQGCQDFSVSETHFNDTLQPGVEYCYNVTADFSSPLAEDTTSAKACYTLNASVCLATHPLADDQTFCHNTTDQLNAIATCDASNQLNITLCSAITGIATSTCYYKPLNGKTTTNCTQTVDGVCELCNGPYSMFGAFDFGLKTSLDIGLTSCSVLEATYNACYFDKTLLTVNKYYDCSEVTSCYDYQSAASCNDPCNKLEETCQWNSFKGLTGVCMPVEKEKQDCDKCNDEQYNHVFPGCLPEMCNLFGDACYYTDINNADLCTGPGTEIGNACFYYMDEAACGIPSASLDETTNMLTKSNDNQSLGTCDWTDAALCIKDADDDGFDDCPAVEFSTLTEITKCRNDNIPPESTVSIEDVYDVGKFDVGIAVKDNAYADVPVLFSMTKCDDETCDVEKIYPDKTFPELQINESENSYYLLRYFAKDASKNLEVIKEKVIQFIAPLAITERANSTIGHYDINYGWLHSLSLHFSTNREAFCKGILTPVNQDSFAARIDRLGNDFAINYANLGGATYNFDISCQDAYSEPVTERWTFSLEGDYAIYNVTPKGGTFNSSDVVISFLVSNDTVDTRCNLSRAGPTYALANYETWTTGNKEYHTALKHAEPGKYEYYAACVINVSAPAKEYLEGDLNDMAYFWIDTTKPLTTVFELSSNKPVIFNNSKIYENVTLLFSCNDTNLDNVEEREDMPSLDHNFGCNAIYYTNVSLNASCPAQGVAYTALPSENPTLKVDYKNPGKAKLCYYSVDNGGNKETTKHVLLNLKNLKPFGITIALVPS